MFEENVGRGCRKGIQQGAVGRGVAKGGPDKRRCRKGMQQGNVGRGCSKGM